MPGLHLVFKYDQFRHNESANINFALEKCLHHQDYKIRCEYDSSNLKIYSTGYDSYPITLSNAGNMLILIEGKIYNKPADRISDEVKKIFDNVKSNNYNYLKSWLKETDGDFIITCINTETSDWLILNDYLGRLPFYLFKEHDRIIISREILFYNNILGNISFDKIGISESLLFGYPLKDRTLFDNIKRIPPATLIYFISEEKRFHKIKVLELDLNSNKEEKPDNINELVETAVQLFKTGVHNRLDNTNWNIISLSGGLDSRSVAAACSGRNQNLIAATYVGYNKVAENDSKVAQKIADKLNLNWKLYNINSPTFDNALRLLGYKCGMNTLLSSFLLSFYQALLNDYGRNAIYITGDGGDKVFPDHRAPDKSWNIDKLIDYTVSTKYFLNIKQIAKLLSISAQDILHNIKSTFIDYPETDFRDKFKRFIIAERGIKWLFEAEDRNRFYFQSIAPMYSVPFFSFMMNVNDNLKVKYRFYNHFINRLYPEINKFENALWGMPIDNNLNYLLFSFMKEQVYPLLPGSIKRKLRIRLNKMDYISMHEYPVILNIWNNLIKQDEITDIFSVEELKKINNLSKAEFYLLFTVLLSVEFLVTGDSSMRKFSETQLI
ncbi:MAG: hypothetical protein Kow0098_16980 [Ignavibacteriaceae bacterium]